MRDHWSRNNAHTVLNIPVVLLSSIVSQAPAALPLVAALRLDTYSLGRGDSRPLDLAVIGWVRDYVCVQSGPILALRFWPVEAMLWFGYKPVQTLSTCELQYEPSHLALCRTRIPDSVD